MGRIGGLSVRGRPLFGLVVVAGLAFVLAACRPPKEPPPPVLVLPTTFEFTGEVQRFRVLAGVCEIAVNAFGAQGGSVSSSPAATGGLGGRAIGTVVVTPGETLEVIVGDQGGTPTGPFGASPAGAGGFNGGAAGGIAFIGVGGAGGGGASDVRRSPFGVDGRLVGAGGGGGAGAGANPPGGNGLGGHGGGTRGTAGTGGAPASSRLCPVRPAPPVTAGTVGPP